MLEYSEKTKKLFLNPMFGGELENADACGLVGDPDCGDFLKVWIKVKEDTIENIRYHFGSGEKIYITLSERDESVIKVLSQLPIVKSIKTSGNHIEIQTDGRRDYREEIGRFLFEKKAIILEMRQSSSSLEDAFVTITERKLSDIANQGLFDKV